MEAATIGMEEKFMDALYIPKSNTEAGRRILKDAPVEAPGFKTFADFLVAATYHKIEPLDMRVVVPGNVSANWDLVFQKTDKTELKLDLFTPKNPAKVPPLVVMIHGGCWISGSRKDYAYYGIKLAQLGYAAASIDYRLSQEATYPAAIEDARTAIQWLKDHAKTYNFDPERIALFGGSAGGHMVEYLGYAANTPTKQHQQGPGPKVKAIVAFYGWSDLTDPAVTEPYWNEAFFGNKYADAPEVYKEASPLTHVSKQSPPTLLLHGTIDTIVPISQSVKLVEKLETNNVPYLYVPFKGQFHAFDLFKDANQRSLYFIEKFLTEYL
jgi:acetyl esterase/lipase